MVKKKSKFIIECACCSRNKDCTPYASSRGPYTEAICKDCEDHWERKRCMFRKKKKR